MSVSRKRLPAAQEAETHEDDAPIMPRPRLHAARTDDREPQRDEVHAPARRTRRKKSNISEDIFYIPQDEIPDGSSYEWKRWTVMGMEDPFYIAQMREQGWEPVDPKRHPNWLPPGYSASNIIKGGQILMERPMELTKEARAENRQLAKRQVIEAEQRLGMTPKDTLTREHPDIKPRLTKEVGRMIPTAIED